MQHTENNETSHPLLKLTAPAQQRFLTESTSLQLAPETKIKKKKGEFGVEEHHR